MKKKLSVLTWARGIGLAPMFAASASGFGQGIIVVNPQPQPTYSLAGFPLDVSIDINGDGTPDFILRSQDSGTTVNNAVLIPLDSNQIVTANAFVADMHAGETVGSSLSPVYQWSNTKTTIGTLAVLLGQQSSENGNFAGQTNGYIGFDLILNRANYYGWMYVSAPNQEGLAGDAGIFGTITQWAYQSTPNTPIAVGAVPEPSVFALLGLSTLMLYAARRKN